MIKNENVAEEDSLFHVNDYSEFIQAASKILENNKLNKKYGILYLDILDFKLVNDFYGFQEGDRLLSCVAKFLNGLPHTKVCGRVFSDHFIRMFEYTGQDEIKIREVEYGRAVRKFLREQRSFHEKCTLKIAAGAAFIQEGPDGLTAAIDQANKARETFILQALENKEFTFYLQPKVDLYTGKIVGAEALARGIYGKGVSSPGEFIPITEKNGSILMLSEGVEFQVPECDSQVCLPVNHDAADIPVLEEETATAEDDAIQRTWEHTVLKKKKHFGAISVILVLVFLSVFTIFYHYRNRLETEFTTLISENINSYTKTQSMEIESFQSSVVGTLEAICYLIESGEIDAQSRELNDYLSRIGQKERYLKVTYVTMDKFSNILKNAGSSEEDTNNYNLLLNGNNAISEVQYSSVYDGYYYSIAVPVRINGVTEGTVRGVISAERLIGTKQHSTQIEIIDSMVVKSDGTLVKISKSQSERAGSLEEELKKYHISEKSVTRILNALYSDVDIQTFTLEGELNEKVFVSTAKLGYNDWHTVNFAVSSSIASHSSVILKKTVQVGIILIVLMLIAGFVVVREMLRAERRSRYENEKYATLAQFSDTVLIQYDYRTDTISVTPNAAKHFKTEFLQKSHYIKEGTAILGIHNEDLASFRNIVQNPRRSEKVYTVNVRLTDKSEKYIWCSLQYRYLFEGNQPVAFIGKITDISHQMKREEQLRVQSCIDGLTHLLNKTASEQRIRKQMEAGRPGVLMMMDIDNFKQINDRFGHASGDEALSSVGTILQETFREGDVIGRVGGDEFLIYMENTESAKAAASRAADVLRKLEQYSVKHRVHISSSIGIAIYPLHGKSFEELFKTADHAMYQAKQLGKNGYYIAAGADRGESGRT